MTSVKRLVAAIVVLTGLTSASAEAAIFDWTYEFDSGVTLSGVFDGTLGIDLDTIAVTAVSDVTAEGVPFVPALFLSSVTDFFGGSSAPFVSLSGNLMDICADTSGFCSGDGFFFDTLNGAGAGTDIPNGIFTGQDNPFDASAWTIQERRVPAPAALPLLVSGLGALGVMGWRRKRKAAGPTA